MLCSEVQLVKYGDGYRDLKPLPCNRWTCEYCGPKRKRRLLALAASGQPNKMLTLTVSPRVGTSPTDRRNKLHEAWKKLTKRILRQFAWEPDRRWKLKSSERAPRAEAIVRSITARTAKLECRKLHYMAFLERTKLGEPHLHILLRSPYVPQDWIAEQMADLVGSPVCDIRQIRSTRAAVYYVTKYVTKEPAQFGKTKRYWLSRDWEVNKGERREREHKDYGAVSVRRELWLDTQFDIERKGKRLQPLTEGWFRVFDTHRDADRHRERAQDAFLAAN